MKRINRILTALVNDTLKRDKNGVRRWSKTALTMFSAWMAVLYSYIHHLIVDGFHFDAFALMAGVATGLKVTDAVSKKLNPDNIHE